MSEMSDLVRRIEQSLHDHDSAAQRTVLAELRALQKDVPSTRAVNIYQIMADYLERRMDP